jgi:hypothetical protein
MLEVSSNSVEGEERRAACCQHSNTEAFDCSLGFWSFSNFEKLPQCRAFCRVFFPA